VDKWNANSPLALYSESFSERILVRMANRRLRLPGCGSRYLDELSRVHRAGGKVRHGPACGGNCDCNWSLIERGHSAHGGDVSKVPCTDSIEGGPDIPLLKVVPPWTGGQGNKLDVVADFFCGILSFTKFAFGLEPKLFISSYRAVVFFPDFPGALSDFFFVGLCQSSGSLFQLRCQGQYALDRFPIAYPPREVAVQWIRGVKASTGARNWRAHLRAFCGKPALAETAHRAFAPVYGRS
jgi:hypothetical protein